ncbi:flagellar basal body rod protein FlgB [Vulgatibacter incomptus]|uniref:Flagellar basal body rod protein FlgB n=1 Tax=Vulgatibacter incomptus TaxID=1391653 RepID=A0A0K1PHZ7_9BACT|nr:flagellar basal body rod protein FlgB [Vulgatibacter incomptus]AKU93031.1 Flagellar basal-body rod protein FlgB [Vulgatibacter incomptus]
MKLTDSTLADLQRALDVRMRRHEVLSANVANADTPAYVARDLDFDAAMSSARQSVPITMPGEASSAGHAAFLPLAGPGGTAGDPAGHDAELVPLAGTSPGLDRNAVDLDRTMVAMAENALLYGATARAASKKLSILRYVASDGNA